jgi:hypothetical protein
MSIPIASGSFLPDGGVFTVTLRNNGEPNWDNGSVHQVDFAIPATDNNGNPDCNFVGVI